MTTKTTLDLIGNTPLLSLDRLAPGRVRLLAKAEHIQPGGSVKDRAARQVIEDALVSGALRPGQPVVEMTSGNMGAGLAVVCNVKGHPFTAVMTAGNSPARRTMLEALGAEVVLTPQDDGEPGRVTGRDLERAIDAAKTIAAERGAFYVDQFHNRSSVRAHEEGTGPEICSAVGSQLAAFVAVVGSGGTFVGTSRFLKRVTPHVVCAAVEPAGAEVLAGNAMTKPRHLLQGTGYGFVPPLWEPALADAFLTVSDEEATHYRRLLATREGLHVGYSAAANVCAAIKLMDRRPLPDGSAVVTLLCDTGFKY